MSWSNSLGSAKEFVPAFEPRLPFNPFIEQVLIQAFEGHIRVALGSEDFFNFFQRVTLHFKVRLFDVSI